MIYRTTFSAMKTYALDNALKFKFLEETDGYLITLSDKEITYQTYLSKTIPSSELTDFETNFKDTPAPLAQEDTDGAQIVRVKAAKRGWTYCALPFEFKTSEIDSLYSKDANGNNRTWITIKFFDSNNNEITSEGLLELNETTIIKTVIDFEPPFDYEIIGGMLRIDQDITSAQSCRLWIVAVPDIPANMGGSKEMASGINLKYLAPSNDYHVDGRVSKFLTYNPTLHTNKLRFIFQHTAGLKVPIQVVVDLYKE